STRSRAVIPRIRLHEGANQAHPAVRPGRTRRLDPYKDRLATRSAPLGLLSRRTFGHLRFAEALRSGEDIAFSTQIWFSGERLAFDRRGPAYRVHDGAADRVSFTTRSMRDSFAFLDTVTETTWFRAL